MSLLQAIVRAVGADPLTRATERCYLRALLDPAESHPSLENLVHHLVAVEYPLLETIARSELRESQPELVQRLIVHSYNQAEAGKSRGIVRGIANMARCAGRLPVSPGEKNMLLTEAQQAALTQLDALVEIYFAQAASPAPVRMRIAPLLVAPSGAGKTFLAGLLAQRHGFGLLRTSVSEWMVQGSKATEPTLNLIREAIEEHPHGLVLHIDELDKLQGHESWSIAQRGEIFCCAGDRNVTGGGWTDKHRAALRDKVFMVGSGTWQEVWTSRLSRHRGFSEPDLSTGKIEEEIRGAKVIPDELLFRWGPMIPLHPYTVRDFEKIGQQLGLERQFLDPVEAARSGLNFRAIEIALSQRALAAHQARRRATLNPLQS